MADQSPINNPTITNAVNAEKDKPHPVKRFFKRLFLSLFFILIVGSIVVYAIFNYTYSDGNRAGTLIKFSKKGYVFKTFEGELNLGGVNPIPGNTIANNMWIFSVKDEAVAYKLMEMEGKNVRLHYKEKVRNLPWQGDTKYFVDQVEEVK
ncbi:MAG: hypothetical protein U0U67_00545 [Chitinophagales bacterium]